eukprot:276800-Pelagomonas_calceolata.AAC.1
MEGGQHACALQGGKGEHVIKLVVGVPSHEGLESRAETSHGGQAPRWLASFCSWLCSESKFTAYYLTFLRLD